MFFTVDFVQFLTENSDFIVVGIIGPPGVGKSTIMNELYGYDGASVGNPEKKLFFSMNHSNYSLTFHLYTIYVEINITHIKIG